MIKICTLGPRQVWNINAMISWSFVIVSGTCTETHSKLLKLAGTPQFLHHNHNDRNQDVANGLKKELLREYNNSRMH